MSNIVKLKEERIKDAGAFDFPHHSADQLDDGAWDLETFRRRMSVKVGHLDRESIDFDLVGIDASVANALRRCLIAEVPSVAVDKAYIFLNTSLVQDEVIAHRIAFVPLKVTPSLFRYRKPTSLTSDATTIVFTLQVRCSHRSDVAPGETDPEQLYENAHVYSNQLVWEPKGDQADWLQEDPPRPALDDILLVKLRPGQEIEMELHCELGRGKDHAKYSPVATASYRLMPSVELLQPIPPSRCDAFAACFAKGVVEVTGDGEERKVRVVNPRRDTVSREVLRHNEFKDSVNLGRVRDHFIFSIETTGAYKPQELLPAAISEMLTRINIVRKAADRIEPPDAMDDS